MNISGVKWQFSNYCLPINVLCKLEYVYVVNEMDFVCQMNFSPYICDIQHNRIRFFRKYLALRVHNFAQLYRSGRSVRWIELREAAFCLVLHLLGSL